MIVQEHYSVFKARVKQQDLCQEGIHMLRFELFIFIFIFQKNDQNNSNEII